MTRFALAVASAFLLLSGAAKAAAVGFMTDPFAGSTALSTPGRQVVGGEPFITFSPATDQFIFDLSVFGVTQLVFANDIAANLPATGVNAIVLRSLDDDANPATAFGAGSAASLIAAQLTGPGPGFFIYFNSGLNLPRLVFSTDLSDPTADLKILARLTNLAAQPDALATFSSANFVATPVPPAFLLMAAPLVGAALLRRRRLVAAGHDGRGQGAL